MKESMTPLETIVTVGATALATGIVAAVGRLYTDNKNKKKEALDLKKENSDYAQSIIDKLVDDRERLITEKERLIAENEKLLTLVEDGKKERLKLAGEKEDCQKRVHDLEVIEQKKNNEIQLLKIKNNT